MQSQPELANVFRALHLTDTPLILPNVWDPLTAAMVAEAGFPAVATASAAVALSRGFDDGEQILFEELVELVKCIGSVVDVPVSVDFERGYGDTPQHVGENTARLIEAGAVGVNIEDSHDHDTMRSIDDQCERIAAVRVAGETIGVPIFINARTDVFMLDAKLHAEAIPRLRAYVEAGADGVYPIMCDDRDTLEKISQATEKPINVFLKADTPPVSSLVEVGVRRISMGPGLLSLAMGATNDALRRLADGDLQLDNLARLTTTEMRRIQGI
jgi:2-methylisocitrate lyase-like PEP mutase family enzyme